MEEYEANRKARLEHDKEWWGNSHFEPGKEDPDRQHIYAHNPPISNEEFQETWKTYNESIQNPETGVHDSLSDHLRPSTPPTEKAMRQLRGLKKQGVNITEELAKEVISHYTTNSGMVAALTEWSQDETSIPVEHANELQKGTNRLMLEMAKQMRDLQFELDQTKTSLQIAEEDAQKLAAFHETAFQKVNNRRVAWIRNKGIYDGLSGNDERAGARLQVLLNETTDHWNEIHLMYDTAECLPRIETPEQGGDAGDMGLPSAFEQRGRELRDKGNQIEKLKRELQEKEQVVENLKLKRDKSSFLSSFEVSRENTPENSRVPSVTSMAPSVNSIQMEEEMKRLKQENSDLQQKLADTFKQNESKLQEASEETRNLRAEVQTQKEDIKQFNNRILVKDREFTKHFNNIRQEGNLYRNRLKLFEVARFRTADSLIAAIGKDDTPSYIKQKIGLRDWVNYLNILSFIQTSAYLQLALIEGAERVAERILVDLQNWAKLCHKDFETMYPSVNIQIGTSIRILDAVKMLLTTKEETDVKVALDTIKDGVNIFGQYDRGLAFSQLHNLAQGILKKSGDGGDTKWYMKRTQFKATLEEKLYQKGQKEEVYERRGLTSGRRLGQRSARRSGRRSG
ncbi:hypothetical protein FPOAC1_003108 [Fusarium poae]|uniref:hypothetical protein n=1 Tax=Fusarium poae TaxID=36050 RepID=UPI001CE90EB0|nr:hypothetical protein FPOAC1_003108 [Fusarium poae]KAG8677097.1 hypothetical protein FPOAC1_003108 [Fusarium poae]